MKFGLKFLFVILIIRADARPSVVSDDVDVLPYENHEIESFEEFEESALKSRFNAESGEDYDDNLNKEQGAFFQGDIELDDDQHEILFSPVTEEDKLQSRTGLLGEQYRWPKNNRGLVYIPYLISTESNYTDRQKTVLKEAMTQIANNSCIRYVERTTQENHIFIRASKTGCNSRLGMVGGRQYVSLDPGCFMVGTVIHELIHALGYTHMHNHIDRDKFVKILWDNIVPQQFSNFKKVNLAKYGNFNTTYDFGSLMHYGPQSFHKSSGLNTIVPRDSRYLSIMGQRLKLSKGDIRRINNMYEC